MDTKEKLEPIFSDQEQAVVYLFSRYWERLSQFKGGTIRRIHTHFPDFELLTADHEVQAIEFEYRLSSFRSHLEDRGACLRKLMDGGTRTLHIVYWDDDCGEQDLCEEIRRAGYGETIWFTCLKDYFTSAVERGDDTLPCRAAWQFQTPEKGSAYTTAEIGAAARLLVDGKDIQRLRVCPNLWRTVGFNKSGSDFVECGHWRQIHFFTSTSRFDEESIPQSLLVKPSGCRHFEGYFQVTDAFKIPHGHEATETLRRFFNRYYFFGYDREYHAGATCFVYSEFTPLSRALGTELFELLVRRGYRLDVRGSIKIRNEEIAAIDAVLSAASPPPSSNSAAGQGALAAIQRCFHAVIRQRAGHLIDQQTLTLPDLEELLAIKEPKVWFPVPGMYGGFSYWLEPNPKRLTLITESWCRVAGGSGQRHEITSYGSRLTGDGFV